MHSRLKMMADSSSLHSEQFFTCCIVVAFKPWRLYADLIRRRPHCVVQGVVGELLQSKSFIYTKWLLTYVLHWFEAIFFLNWAYFYVSTNMNQSKQFETSQDMLCWYIYLYPTSYLPVMQLKFQSCFEIKSRRIIMCVRQVFCQWFILFYWSVHLDVALYDLLCIKMHFVILFLWKQKHVSTTWPKYFN